MAQGLKHFLLSVKMWVQSPGWQVDSSTLWDLFPYTLPQLPVSATTNIQLALRPRIHPQLTCASTIAAPHSPPQLASQNVCSPSNETSTAPLSTMAECSGALSSQIKLMYKNFTSQICVQIPQPNVYTTQHCNRRGNRSNVVHQIDWEKLSNCRSYILGSVQPGA